MRISCRANVIFRPLNILFSLLIALLGKIKNANLPVMIVQGDKDTVVPPENTRTWADSMKEMGMKYEYVEVPDGDHGTAISGGMPNIFKFFADHPKAGVQ